MKKIFNIKKREILISFILLISISAVLEYKYFWSIDKPLFDERIEIHKQIIDGSADSPYRYRVLIPFLAEGFRIALSPHLIQRSAFNLTYAILEWLAIFWTLAALFLWLRIWFTWEQSLVGALFVAGTMSMALQDHFFQPWSLLEAGVFSSSLICIYKKNYWTLTLLVVLASLNRETAIFIPLTLFFTIDFKNILTKQQLFTILFVIVLIFLSAEIYWVLRYLRGNAPHISTLQEFWAENIKSTSLFNMSINWTLFLGGLWMFAILGYKLTPLFIRKIALIVPIYLITILIWGVWVEVRLLMVMYPILVSIGLFFIFPKNKNQSQSAITI
jgi:hypothetical protein